YKRRNAVAVERRMALLLAAVLPRDAALIAEVGIAALLLPRSRTNIAGIERGRCFLYPAAKHRVFPLGCIKRRLVTGARLSTGLEFLFDAGDGVLQVLAALFLLR